MKKLGVILQTSALLLFGCNKKEPIVFNELIANSSAIEGKQEYLNSPYVTAGDRVYAVGHQNGSFPDLGWHITGEMGGIWNHPIKLMDGFEIDLILEQNDTLHLNKANKFTNYPFANKFGYTWDDQQIAIDRWQFVPDGKQGMVVQLVIKNLGPERKARINFTSISDLRPTWLGEKTNMIDGKDLAAFDETKNVWKVKDSLNNWHSVFGSQLDVEQSSSAVSIATHNNTAQNSIEDVISLNSGATHIVNYFIAGSYTSEAEALNTYQALQQDLKTDLNAKRERYMTLANQTKLTIPNKRLEQTFEWLKYNCDWLIRDVPEIGRGITAGIPDYPWWFGVDSEYALQGYMAIGQDDIVHSTIKLLDSVSNKLNGNGRIIHEMSTNGYVFNPGNINETPQYASLIWNTYKWNGDKEFLAAYFPTIKKGLHWLMTEKDADKNLFPDGFGMMEIHGLDSEMIDVAAYTQRAFADAAKIAEVLGDAALANEYSTMAATLKTKINDEFWSEEFQSFADFIGTDAQTLHLIEDALVRADTLNKPWAVEELKATKQAILNNPSSTPRPFVLHHNWVVNTPMEMGIADDEKALKALQTAEKYVNPFGVFVTGIDRDDSAGSDDGSFQGAKVFSYTGAVMTLPTGVQVIAENNYGRPDKALNYLERMTRSFSFALPGSMYEVSPDYGMITQAWNIYSFAVPIVQQFFGFQPMAAEKKVTIAPQMPSTWDNASLEHIKVTDNSFSVYYNKTAATFELKVTQTEGWEVRIELPKDGTYTITSGEGKMIPDDEHYVISTTSNEILITN